MHDRLCDLPSWETEGKSHGFYVGYWLLVFFASLLTGCFLVFSFPSYDLWWLAWISLIPLMVAVRRCPPLLAFGMGYVAGVVFYSGVLWWLTSASVVRFSDFLLLSLYLAIYLGIFAAGVSFFSRQRYWAVWLAAPALWIGLEFLRLHIGAFEFPWALLGYTQYEVLPLIQFSSWTGVYGVSFLIVLVNVALMDFLLAPRRVWRPALAVCLTLAGLVGYGLIVLHTSPVKDTPIQVAVVSGHIPQSERWDAALWTRNYKRHVVPTLAEADRSSPTLIVWPETAVPFTVNLTGTHLPRPQQLARRAEAYFLFGTAGKAKFQGGKWKRARNRNNTALLLSPDGQTVDRYHKIKLFPFGEYLPYPSLIPWPSRAISQTANFLPGQDYTVFSISPPEGPSITFSSLLCWESAFPGLVREFVNRGAGFLVNMSNEAWFDHEAFPRQFLSTSIFRAVENRISVVRAANYGYSSFIDPYGRILQEGDLPLTTDFSNGNLAGSVPVSYGGTVYSRFGDVFVWFNILGLGLWTVIIILRSKHSWDFSSRFLAVIQMSHSKLRN